MKKYTIEVDSDLDARLHECLNLCKANDAINIVSIEALLIDLVDDNVDVWIDKIRKGE